MEIYNNTNTFSSELLNKSKEEKYNYFHNKLITHPNLEKAILEVMNNIENPAGISLFMITGPTGVGKTTLKNKVEMKVIESRLLELDSNKGIIPIAGIEAVAPDAGYYNWKDHYKRSLEALCEPMINYKIDYEKIYKTNSVLSKSENTASAYRKSLENALRNRRPAAFIIDEAQHITKVASGKRLQDQLDIIKSLSNLSGIIHILIGTYDLGLFIDMNGQLSRRTANVHFPRYKAENNDDIRKFISVVKTFENHMPLENEVNILKYWEFIYERTIGCVGILKNWLERCLWYALDNNYKTISYELLKEQALSLGKIEKIAIEAIQGEKEIEENEDKRKELHKMLKLDFVNISEIERIEKEPKNKVKTSVGKRKPHRDAVGGV